MLLRVPVGAQLLIPERMRASAYEFLMMAMIFR